MSDALGKQPVILVAESDVIKPHGKKFEALGQVRDGSSKDIKIEKEYKSTNEVLFHGLKRLIDSLSERATVVFDRGYDMNTLFNLMTEERQGADGKEIK